jgi:UDP-N-acetylmuramoylalanine--D-glutamate ligase
MDDYFFDKSAIYQYQHESDVLIANTDLTSRIESHKPKSHIYYFNKTTFPGEITLMGDHNRENASAAYLAAQSLSIDDSIIQQTIQFFSGLLYRIQNIEKIIGIDFIHDTTSTTPIACEKAIESLKGRKITLILGGNSKNLPFDTLLLALDKVQNIILLKGSFTDQIMEKLDKNKVIGEPHDSLENAIKSAFASCPTSGVILFSPGATSFAQFKNEFHRGDEFNRIIKIYETNS